MITQETRDKVADWLQMVIDRVGEITEGGNPKKFQMGTYITGWDSEHNCGTCCCIEGWLPVIIPNEVTWGLPFGAPFLRNGDTSFYPSRLSIPLKDHAWSQLTISGPPELVSEYYMTKSYAEIKEIWYQYTNMIRAGQLDHKLIDND